jgi:hypothetical protein
MASSRLEWDSALIADQFLLETADEVVQPEHPTFEVT